MSIDYRTGEIVETTALATIDKSSAASVIGYLEQAKTWLATCVELTGPTEIAVAKAEIATAAEATKQLHLSKEIQLDAQEMVRRAEYALGKSIRKGQAEGTIRKIGDDARTDLVGHNNLVSPKEFAPKGELHGSGTGPGIMHLADMDQGHFEAAVEQAKAEGNLSRANVVRKVRAQASPSRPGREAKAEILADLAAQGYSSRQMCKQLGYARDDQVRELAREFDIEIPADRAIAGTRRHNSHRIASETVAALEGLAMGVDLIKYDEIDPAEARQWADSLNHSLRALNRFQKQIKETTHD